MSTNVAVTWAGYVAAGFAVGLFATFILKTGTKVLSTLEAASDGATADEGNR